MKAKCQGMLLIRDSHQDGPFIGSIKQMSLVGMQVGRLREQ